MSVFNVTSPALSAASLSPSDSSSSSSPSEASSPSPRLIILSDELPLPTAPRPFSTKKSHARKQPIGHIPRPRNAFILFRCDYARQKNERKLPKETTDQNDMSRLVGSIWRNMTREQRAPWVVLAEAEKKKHAVLYPGYKFASRRKASITETEVEAQITREAEKAVETEVVQRATGANSKDMVTVYYPPWATRRTLTYFARRAMSCPPEGAVSIEPYTEMMDRAMVTSNVKVYAKEAVPEKEEKVDTAAEQSNSTAENVVFAPSAYGIYGGDSSCSSENLLSWSVAADLSLSQGYYTIKPPGGTGSWAEEPPLPSEYAGAHYSIDPLYISPFFHAHQGELAMSQYSHAPTVTPPHEYAAYRNYWVSDIPALPPSPTDTSPSSSPVTPPGNSMVLHPAATDEGVQCAEPSSNNEVLPRESFTQSGQDEFVTEFRDVLHPLSSERYELRDNTFGTGADVVAREPLIRTSYQDSTAYSSSSRALSTQS